MLDKLESCAHRILLVQWCWPSSYITAGAASMAQRGELQGNVDVLIVDPPRKGLDEEVLEQLERYVNFVSFF